MHDCMNQKNRYVHYPPNPTEGQLLKLFSDVNQDIVIYGHDHNRRICHSQNRWFINSGSLGCPANDKNIARAAILEIEENNIFVYSIEIEYDARKVVEYIDGIKCPASEEIKKIFFGVN